MARQARILARTGHRPTIWGLEGQGITPRAQVAGMSACRYPGDCSTIAICLGFAQNADPVVSAPLQLLREWLEVMDELDSQKALEITWQKPKT